MSKYKNTRVYWEGSEVRFISWTDQGLIFDWGDLRETVINMPRGTVRRLIAKGVLCVEGDRPAWTFEDDEAEKSAAQREREAIRPRLSAEQQTKRVGLLARLIRKLGTEGASG